MNQVFFEGVRCFPTLQSCPLSPITLLVGENSTGKTTFLALTRIAWDILHVDFNEDFFNEEPFLLGSFEQVASYRSGRAGRMESFTVGVEINLREKFHHKALQVLFGEAVAIKGCFVAEGLHSKLNKIILESGEFRLIFQVVEKGSQQKLSMTYLLGSKELTTEVDLMGGYFNFSLLSMGLNLFPESQLLEKAKGVYKKEDINIESFRELWDKISPLLREKRPYAFAPIRTRPQRTYDPLKDVPQPEGGHVPMYLARIASSDPASWKRIKQSLTAFGKASGLFSSVEILRKGHKEGDPFQIGVKASGPVFNLMDVGYGVSQVLPIIVDSLREPEGTTFLLQQPEVHLHPRAQAALGSFLATVAKEQNKRFIIETHSDYLVDRIRLDVRDQKILDPEDVALLYFEKKPSGVEIHQLELDRFGNILNAPAGYREFFLKEERRLFEGMDTCV